MNESCSRIKLHEVDQANARELICGPDIRKKIFDEVSPAVVKVNVSVGWEAGGNGTGFFVNAKQIITNSHVILSGDNLSIEVNSGAVYQGKVLKVDEVKDLALVELVNHDGSQPDGKALKLRKGAIDPGEKVWALGHPGDSSDIVFSPGVVDREGARFDDAALKAKVVSEIDQKQSQQAALSFLSQPVVFATVKIEPGSSGGPATNSAGELTFVTSLAHARAAGDHTGISSGVGSNQVKDFLQSGHSDFKIDYGWQSNLEHRPVKTLRDDFSVAAASVALPQLFMPLTSAYHGYKFLSEQNTIRKVADSAIVAGSILAIAKVSRLAGIALYGAGLAIDAGSDAFVKDNLVAKKIERTDGTERLPAGSLVLEKANELLQH